MSRYIDRVHIMNRIATECHYDTEHPLESYSKLLEVINEECGYPKEEKRELIEGQVTIWEGDE